MKLNVLKTWYTFVIVFFFFCERVYFMQPIEALHLKHYLVMATVVFSIAFINGKKIKQFENYLPIIFCTAILYIISLGYQVVNAAFQVFALEEVYYFLIPLALVLIVYNSTNNNYIDDYINSIFWTLCICFVIIMIHSGNLTLGNFLSLFSLRMLFIDSESTIVETDLGVYFALLYLYYNYKEGKDSKFKRIVSFILCFIAYKRIAVLFTFAAAIFLRFVPKHKKTNNAVLYLTIAIFIIAPFAVYYMCDDTFAHWFLTKTGIDFNEFTMSRFEIINAVIDRDLTNFGLGTVSNFLERRGRSGQLNMHNDILKIYMECGLLGTVVFTYSYFKIAKDNIYKYIIMLFVFLELFGAHFLGSGSISFWILVYLMLIQIGEKEQIYADESEKQRAEALEKMLDTKEV